MLFIFIALISLILQLFLPWWIIGPVAFGLAAWKAKSGSKGFGSAFWAVFLVWAVAGLFKTIPNENILANRVGQMLRLPASSFSWIAVLIISCLVGGLAAGFSALAGYHFRNALGKPVTRRE